MRLEVGDPRAPRPFHVERRTSHGRGSCARRSSARRSHARRAHAIAAAGLSVLAGLLPSPARADDDKGFRIGLGILGDWIGAEDPAPDASDDALYIEDGGGGVSVTLGYDWSRQFGLALRMSGARHDTTLDDISVAHNSAEIEAHWRPGSHADVRPYLFGGVGGNTLRVDTDLADADVRGGSAVLGSGVLVRLRGNFWFDLAGRLQFINWDEIEVTLSDGNGDQVSASTPVDESGTAGQITVGVVWGF